MDNEISIKPIAVIHTDFKEKFGIPRQSGRVKNTVGKIVFNPEFRNLDAVRNITDFSYLWLIFDFSLCHKEEFSPTVRPPRLGGNFKVGVFASRSPFRPNPLGLSSVKLLSVDYTDKDAPVLIVGGVDLLDGTPIFDIKPYIPYSDCHKMAKYGYSKKEKGHKLKVKIPKNIKKSIPKDKLKVIIACIKDDPKPSYKTEEKIYGFKFSDYEVKFSVKGKTAEILSIE